MALEQVAEDILSEGERRASLTLEEARRERERSLSEARESSRAILEKKRDWAEKEIARLRIRELAGAELEARRARLEMEREMLRKAAELARRRIEALSEREEEELLSALLRKAQKGYRVFAAGRSGPLLRKNPGIEFAGEASGLGGLVLESPDGSVRMELTYDRLLEEAVERTVGEVHRILFPRAPEEGA